MVSPYKLMGIYIGVLILGVTHLYMVSTSFSCCFVGPKYI